MKNSKKTISGMEIRRTLAKNLKRLRELQNVSQLELSGMTGLTHNFINDIENCKKWISADTLARFASALQVQPFQLFLSELLAEESEDDPASVYREDFSDMFQKLASDWMNTYLPKNKRRN
jgi:transcriptional regulator with XRE-family HTH domain